MPYRMEIYVDGGCRRNGYRDAIGAAAAVRQSRGSTYWVRKRQLSSYEEHTNQRAEITAIILGLEMALDAYRDLFSNPYLYLTVYSDSKYAVGCMTDWIYKWCRNGWTNSHGLPVANQDLIEKASDLDDQVGELGSLHTNGFPARQMNSRINTATRN